MRVVRVYDGGGRGKRRLDKTRDKTKTTQDSATLDARQDKIR